MGVQIHVDVDVRSLRQFSGWGQTHFLVTVKRLVGVFFRYKS